MRAEKRSQASSKERSAMIDVTLCNTLTEHLGRTTCPGCAYLRGAMALAGLIGMAVAIEDRAAPATPRK